MLPPPLTAQVLQWVFAGAPNHPALRELCDWIRDHATHRFSKNTNRDTLERTGPGVWTDVVLRHALANPPSKVGAASLAATHLLSRPRADAVALAFLLVCPAHGKSRRNGG